MSEERVTAAHALLDRALELHEHGRLDEAIAGYDAAAAAARAAGHRVLEAWALGRRTATLAEAGRPADALATADDVVARFAGDDDEDLRLLVVEALGARTRALGDLGRHEDALVAHAAVLEHPDAQDVDIAHALMDRAWLLHELGREGEAGVVADALVDRFGDAEDPDVQVFVARGRLDHGRALLEAGRHDEALAAARPVAAAEAGDLDRATALLIVGDATAALGHPGAARAAYGEVVARFGHAEDPVLAPYVHYARVRRARLRLRTVLGRLRLRRPADRVRSDDQ